MADETAPDATVRLEHRRQVQRAGICGHCGVPVQPGLLDMNIPATVWVAIDALTDPLCASCMTGFIIERVPEMKPENTAAVSVDVGKTSDELETTAAALNHITDRLRTIRVHDDDKGVLEELMLLLMLRSTVCTAMVGRERQREVTLHAPLARESMLIQ